MLKRIQENIFRHRLFDRGSKIVVGVSGGPDSVCLLDVLHRLEKNYGLAIVIAHVNYGLREKDSRLDEKLAKELAAKYSLPLEIKNVSGPPAGKSSSAFHVSRSEDYLRNIRYSFFEKTREKHKADLIAVGHNLNDQAETVLMRILRGTGLRGLSAIKFKSGSLIRPLLNIPRREIIGYLKSRKISYRIDKTNFGIDFTRNRVRNKLLPLLEKDFNPNIQKSLFRLARSASEDYDFVRNFSAEWLRLNKPLAVSKILALHPAVRKEVLRLAIEEYNPNLKEIESVHIDEILKVIRSTKMKRHQLKFKGLKIVRIGDKLVISHNA